ncbi:hypothetical protein NE237_002594 [Protea cynaroides]|uniref:Small ribosomal subunit protein uS10c n=1 Tax=Protea cynaroides TaxID=273540 RepID=A0A9Q0QZ75_9MAGN|nr:hypothetical protein NE237_002594 [Protea cynaroides]
MAVSSIYTVLPLPPLSNSTMSSKPKRLALSLPQNVFKLQVVLKSRNSRILAVPELLESEETLELPPPETTQGPDTFTVESKTPTSSTLDIGSDVDKMAPKQKIRIKLRSYWVNLIEDSCKQIMDAARTTNAKTVGPVPLPTKKRIYCVLKSPHVHKDARFHFEIRTHQRLIDIVYPTAQTIDSLMQLDLPAGVDVEVKRLKWKFRGNERIVEDGVLIQVSLDVYNWLFDEIENGMLCSSSGFRNWTNWRKRTDGLVAAAGAPIGLG